MFGTFQLFIRLIFLERISSTTMAGMLLSFHSNFRILHRSFTYVRPRSDWSKYYSEFDDPNVWVVGGESHEHVLVDDRMIARANTPFTQEILDRQTKFLNQVGVELVRHPLHDPYKCCDGDMKRYPIGREQLGGGGITAKAARHYIDHVKSTLESN